MNIFPDTGRIRLLIVVCGLMLLSACATSTSVSPESQIEERATARWEALFSGDLADAYEYLTPGYRSSVSSLQYQRSIIIQKITWTSAKYMESNCEETTCDVKVSLGFTVYGALPGVNSFEGTQMVEETWMWIDGQWYFVPAS
jgi:hypothetical protein